MSTHTEGFASRKSSGNSVYGIRWNHISFIRLSPIGLRCHALIAESYR